MGFDTIKKAFIFLGMTHDDIKKHPDYTKLVKLDAARDEFLQKFGVEVYRYNQLLRHTRLGTRVPGLDEPVLLGYGVLPGAKRAISIAHWLDYCDRLQEAFQKAAENTT